MAKDLVRTRRYVKKFIMMKANIQAVSLKVYYMILFQLYWFYLDFESFYSYILGEKKIKNNWTEITGTTLIFNEKI